MQPGDPRFLPVRRIVRPANPAAGAELSITPNTSGLWVVRSIVFTLDTDANAANRGVVLVADDGTAEWFATVSPSVVAANAVARYSAFNGSGGAVTASDVVMLSWPGSGLPLTPGSRLRTETAAIQAGDQFQDVALYVDDFPTGPGRMVRPLAPHIVEFAD